ncbi:TPA: SGNH/GDSL hydrolase family protein, partial [Klebsiella pneumoniae]|nr:SGNH/GDSL hydrolase family protein [Klebsiella pneumoniae]
GTPQGKLFRVALGEGEALAFRYFLNDGGVARAVTGLLGQGSIINSVRFFPSLPLAENDLSAGNIPEGGNCWVINHSDSSLADEYANVSGALQQTGRKMLSQEAVEAALQLIAKLTSSGFVDDNFFPLFV